MQAFVHPGASCASPRLFSLYQPLQPPMRFGVSAAREALRFSIENHHSKQLEEAMPRFARLRKRSGHVATSSQVVTGEAVHAQDLQVVACSGKKWVGVGRTIALRGSWRRSYSIKPMTVRSFVNSRHLLHGGAMLAYAFSSTSRLVSCLSAS